MTCIVGMKDNGKVYIGGDSLGVGGYSKTLRSDAKVFQNGDMIFGYTSSFRMGQILRYSFTPPERSVTVTDDMQYLVNNFIPSLITAYKSGQYLTKKDDAAVGGTFLLGYRGNLYQVESDFQVGIPTLGYDACGCGGDIALGCMYAVKDLPLTPEEKITKCLEAASAHSAGVGGKFEIVSI